MTVTHEQLAARLRDAYVSGPVAPLRDGLDANDVEGAYVIQRINHRHRQAGGGRVIGRKIGLTSTAVQRQLGVAQPDFGALFDDMRIDDAATLASSRLLQGKAEAEIALVLRRNLDNPRATPVDVLAAIDFVLPAIEIVDSRIANWQISIADTIADNASSAYFVLGSEPRSPAGLDLRTCGMVLEINRRIESTGVGAACLGHPLNAAAWLARELAMREEELRAGDVILTGALGPMVKLAAGNELRATIGGVGTVSFAVAETDVR